MKIDEIKKDFPIFENNDISYLDSAATSQKPKCVIDCIKNFYENSNANAHRGAYGLSLQSSALLSNARHKVAKFLNAKYDEEIIFTKNSTEALNLIAQSYGNLAIKKGDEIVLSILEHHSMIVPFQNLAKHKSAELKFLYLDKNYQINEKEIEDKITSKTKIVGISTVSNALGIITDYQKIIQKAHSVGAIVVIDASQSIAHVPFYVQKTDADFVIFSAHKMYGPLGVGVLYGKKQLLEKMPPFLMGGDMIEYVYEDNTTFAPLPNKFEAGTMDVASISALEVAISYIESIGYENIEKVENELKIYLYERLKSLPYIEVYCSNNLNNQTGLISFNVKGVHPHDVASILDMQGVCVRAGNHCAQPLLRWLGINSTVRASIGIYNTKEDIDKLILALEKVYQTFKKYI